MSDLEKELSCFEGEFPDRMRELEDAMLKLPQLPGPVTHSFGPGTYVREVTFPAGAVVIGHHQNFEHLNVFVRGRVTMFNADGTRTELKAPMTFVGKPGRKIGYIHEDVTWINVYPTEERDIEKLEAHFLTKRADWPEIERLNKQAKLLTSGVNASDFEAACRDIGISPDEVRRQSEITEDLTDLPTGSYKLKLGTSVIEGKGIFATADIRQGELIAPARLSGKRTIAGRYANHEATPNAEFQAGWPVGDIMLVATREIAGCRGGYDGEEITIDYRAAHALKMRLEEPCRQL